MKQVILNHYGFSRLPFDKEIAADDIFKTQTLSQPTAMLELGLDSEDIMLLTGPIGCGKSLIVRTPLQASTPTVSGSPAGFPAELPSDKAGQLSLARRGNETGRGTPFFESRAEESHLSVQEAIGLKEELGVKRLVPTHFNHFNRPHDELEAYFSGFKGITAAYDGMSIEI